MRVLVLFAHPVETSYAATLHRATVEGLTEGGHEVDDCDLYAESFNPVLSREERLAYHDTNAQRTAVQPYIDRLRAAEGLVLNFPVWNFGYPAVLKGFFDRVFLPGVAFDLRDGRAWPALHHIRRLGAVVTYGGTRWRAVLVGDPPRKAVKRVIRAQINPMATTRYVALYDMNRNGKQALGAFLERVRAAMRTF